MRTLLLVMIVVLSGCYASQRDSIDESFQDKGDSLDRQCRANMNQWCQMKYADLIARHQEALNNDAVATDNGNRRGVIAGTIIGGIMLIAGAAVVGAVVANQHK